MDCTLLRTSSLLYLPVLYRMLDIHKNQLVIGFELSIGLISNADCYLILILKFYSIYKIFSSFTLAGVL